jgi:Flp pilus assembly protein TadD
MLPMKAVVHPSSDHLGRGDAFERDGRYAEAAEAYRAAVAADPFDADARARLGVVLRELGLDEEANEAFRAALELHAETA